MKIKIIGAGSAGNHMAYALTTLKKVKEIFLTDVNQKSLDRSKNQIFLKRYKKWNNKIKLEIENKNLEKNNKFDAIIISSPPEFHRKNIFDNINKSTSLLGCPSSNKYLFLLSLTSFMSSYRLIKLINFF